MPSDEQRRGRGDLGESRSDLFKRAMEGVPDPRHPYDPPQPHGLKVQ